MEIFLFSANAVLPIIVLTLIGFLLKKIGFLNDRFAVMGNKLCFRVLVPCMLFYNVYSIDSFDVVNATFVLYAVIGVFAVFFIGLFIVTFCVKQHNQKGVLLQCFFRSNYAIIGIPLAERLFGVSGAAAASILGVVTIPLFNVLSVIALSVYGDKHKTVKQVVKSIVLNPLIIGVVLGIIALLIRQVFEANSISFRLSDIEFVMTSVQYLARATTPLALIVLGAEFEFGAVPKLKKQIILGTAMRTAIVPVVLIGLAYLLKLDLKSEHFAAYIALFASPVAVTSSIMAQEMDGDGELAGQLVVWTTIVSCLTIFGIVCAVKALALI